MSTVTKVNKSYDRVYLNDDFFKSKFSHHGQFMIVDCGCPRSIMGVKEYSKLKEHYHTEKLDTKNESFRFGPSQIYKSEFKVNFPMNVGGTNIEAQFFVVEGDNIPILLGNDIMEPLGGSIDMKDKKLVLKKLNKEVSLLKSPGGHFVIPIKAVATTRKDPENKDAIKDQENIKGHEAEAIMLILLANTEDDAIEALHDQIGHSIFVSMALEEDEHKQVNKVHR